MNNQEKKMAMTLIASSVMSLPPVYGQQEPIVQNGSTRSWQAVDPATPQGLLMAYAAKLRKQPFVDVANAYNDAPDQSTQLMVREVVMEKMPKTPTEEL